MRPREKSTGGKLIEAGLALGLLWLFSKWSAGSSPPPAAPPSPTQGYNPAIGNYSGAPPGVQQQQEDAGTTIPGAYVP